MFEVLAIIASLCAIPGSNANIDQVTSEQLACQKYYVKCVYEHLDKKITTDLLGYYDEKIVECIKKKRK